MDWTKAFSFLLFIVPVLLLAVIFTCFPKRVVQVLARMGQQWFFGLPPSEYKNFGPPVSWSYDRAGKETYKLLLEKGEENPELFPTLIKQIRHMGCMGWLIFVFASGLFALWAIKLGR